MYYLKKSILNYSLQYSIKKAKRTDKYSIGKKKKKEVSRAELLKETPKDSEIVFFFFNAYQCFIKLSHLSF